MRACRLLRLTRLSCCSHECVAVGRATLQAADKLSCPLWYNAVSVRGLYERNRNHLRTELGVTSLSRACVCEGGVRTDFQMNDVVGKDVDENVVRFQIAMPSEDNDVECEKRETEHVVRNILEMQVANGSNELKC